MFLPCIGSIGYWGSLVTESKPVITTLHTFQKQSSLSQCEIVTANGRLKISVPTIKQTRKGAYSDVEIDYTDKWQIEWWRGIENAYKKSPFFLYYDYKLKPKILANEKYLLDYNVAIVSTLWDILKMEMPLEINKVTAVYFKEMEACSNPAYPQVFDSKMPFCENVCVLDALFNLGPETLDYLLSINK
jgi:hypothetical protein